MPHRRFARRQTALGLSLVTLLAPLAAAQPLCPPSPTPPPIDNRDGYLVNFEEAPVHPMELSADGKELWVANIPDARVSVFDVTAPKTPQLVAEIGVGLGPVTVRRRPQPPPPAPVVREIWVVCQSSNAVFVIDSATRRVTATVRVPFEPSGLVFDAGGRFAYVTLSASNRVARIDAANLQAAPVQYEVASPMPLGSGSLAHVEEPRALLLEGDDLYVLSFQSGNGTTLLPEEGTSIVADVLIVNQWLGVPAGLPAPPDRDVVQLDAANPGQAGAAVLWRMGTLNFDLQRGGPQGHLYVSTVDLLNDQREGEFDYQANGFAVHAVTHAAPSAAGTPQSGTVVIDLNADRHPDLPAAFRCAVPNEMAIAGDRLYVACYETGNTAVVDLATDQVIAELRADTKTQGFGPRGLALHPSGAVLYVYARGDSRLQVYDLANLTPGTSRGPLPPVVPVGFDITPAKVIAGRFHHVNAANSGSGTATCNTCHMDGHFDGLAWDLSDFTGDLPGSPEGRVPKGAKVTMSLRGIEETPPFHWRGDRADLAKFNPAFEGLLGGSQLTPAQMAEFEAFVFGLSYPPNPHLDLKRDYSAPAREGFDCFSMVDAHEVTTDISGLAVPPDPAGRIELSCAGCHSMAGASGTLNQVNNPVKGLLADDATQLRGLFDKESDIVDYKAAGAGPPFDTGPLDRIPATGWGFANTGFVDTVLDFVNLNVFDLLPDGSQPRIVDFLRELDTGAAPATAFAWTLNRATVDTGATEPAFLMEQDDDGHADLVVRGWTTTPGGSAVAIGMLWDTGLQKLATDTTGLGPYTFQDLEDLARNGKGVFTLIGTPAGMGYRLGLDRDMDFRLDGDEASAPVTSTSKADTDGDTFPDGYEVRLGSDPTSAASTPADAVKPQITQVAMAWKNSNVMKVRWTTDEESVSRLLVYHIPGAGLPAVEVWSGEEGQYKKSHAMVARNLKPGEIHRAIVVTRDPSGNSGRLVLPEETLQDHLFQSAHLTAATLTSQGTNPATGKNRYTVSFTVADEEGDPVPGATVGFTLVEWTAGGGNTVSTQTTGPSDASGVATLTFDGLRDFLGGTGTAEAFATAVDDPGGKRLYFHSLDGQLAFWDQAAVP